jgi:5'-methylthioadenosine phosphorylase
VQEDDARARSSYNSADTVRAAVGKCAGAGLPGRPGGTGVRIPDRGLTFETPWGASENWQVLEVDGSHTPDRKTRTILNVFAHGWPVDSIDHATHRKVGWIMMQAGVRKILSDSTCGSLNKFLKPKDFIIPFDVLDFSQTHYSMLPGRLTDLCLSRQLFCPHLGGLLQRVAQQLWPLPGRVVGQDQQLVAAHNWGPRFSSPAEANAYQVLGADAINQSIGPEASVAREIGACFVSASFIVRFQDGILDRQVEEVDKIHKDLADVASRISLRTMMQADLTDECGCRALHVSRPADYAINAQGRRMNE